jgi:GR25 family glycosyltransferase involved in LPS biosynthesis
MINCKIISIDNYTWFHQNNNPIRRYSERRKNIDSFIEKTSSDKFSLEVLPAVTPIDFSIADNQVSFDNKYFDIGNKDLLYISNNLSHYKIWEIEEDTLVFEDDIVLDLVQIEKITELIESFKLIEDDFKILYLQISTPWIREGTKKSFNFESTNISGIGRLIGNNDISGTAAYFIDKKSKKKILENPRPLNPCDQYLDRFRLDGLLRYYIPTDLNLMFSLDYDTMWLV